MIGTNFFRLLSRKPFKIRIKKLRLLSYTEQGKVILLDGERLASGAPHQLWYWFRPNHRWEPPNATVISETEKFRVKKNIEEHFEEKGVSIVVEIMKEKN